MFFLFIYFVCENLDLTNYNWAKWSHALPFNLGDTIELIYSFIMLYLVEFHKQRLRIDIIYVASSIDFQNYIHNSNVMRNLTWPISWKLKGKIILVSPNILVELISYMFNNPS